MGNELSSCVRHLPRERFFVLYGDMLRLTGGNYAKTCAHRVLETKTNDRLVALMDAGVQEVVDDDLWVTISWQDFEARAMGLYAQRSFQNVLPEMIKEGYVLGCYVRLDEEGRPERDEKTGKVLRFPTLGQAQSGREHVGPVARQYRYCFDKVNAALDRLYPRPPEPEPPGEEDPGKSHEEQDETDQEAGEADDEEQEEGSQQGDAARPTQEGIPGQTTPSPVSSIVPASAKNTRGSVEGSSKIARGVVAKLLAGSSNFASNKNLRESESDSNITEESAYAVAPGGAETKDDLQNALGNDAAVWSIEGILNLAAIWLPALPTNRSRKQLEADREKWQQAAKRLRESSAFAGLSDEERVAWLERQMRYMTDPSSPCSWQKFMRLNHPQAQVRLWHVADNAWSMCNEMEKFGWWPSDVRLPSGRDDDGRRDRGGQAEQVEEQEAAFSAPALPHPHPQRATARVARTKNEDEGVEAAEVERSESLELPVEVEPAEMEMEPVGMDEEEAQRVLEAIKRDCPLLGVRRRKSTGGGYVLEVMTSMEKMLLVYEPEQWDVALAAQRRPLSERLAALRARRAQERMAS